MKGFTSAAMAIVATALAWGGASSAGAAGAPGPAYGNGDSTSPQVSANGRFVVFSSAATNLVTGDTNGKRDIFIRDTVTNTTRRVSTSASGGQANQNSDQATVSNDGRHVAFVSTASNLVVGDTNGKTDVFRKDLTTGAVVRVSVGAGATQGNSGANSGRIRFDGMAVVFSSLASNLVTGDTNGDRDVFVRDLTANTTKRISLTPTGGQVHDAYAEIDYSPDGARIGWFRNECTTSACNDGIGYLMQWSAATGKSVVVDSDSWSGDAFSVGSVRAGLNAVAVSSFGDWDGYVWIGTPSGKLYDFGCEICAFDITSAGTVGSLGGSTSVTKFSKTAPWKDLPARQPSVNGTSITPDGSKIAFASTFFNEPISRQICLWNTAGTTSTVLSMPSGQTASCPVGEPWRAGEPPARAAGSGGTYVPGSVWSP